MSDDYYLVMSREDEYCGWEVDDEYGNLNEALETAKSIAETNGYDVYVMKVVAKTVSKVEIVNV